jgi:exosome complex component RRP45
VLAQVSCEVQQPKATRPNEGLLFLNIELSPMGSPDFEVGRQSELAVQLNRLLEKCIKDSQCVDLESLCIVAEEKVCTGISYFRSDRNLTYFSFILWSFLWLLAK